MAEKSDTLYNLVLKFLYFWSAFFDNWYYLFRIGVYQFAQKESSELVSRLGTGCTILSYTMELCKEWTDAKEKSEGDWTKMKKILNDRRWYIISKLLEYPVSLDDSTYNGYRCKFTT